MLVERRLSLIVSFCSSSILYRTLLSSRSQALGCKPPMVCPESGKSESVAVTCFIYVAALGLGHVRVCSSPADFRRQRLFSCCHKGVCSLWDVRKPNTSKDKIILSVVDFRLFKVDS